MRHETLRGPARMKAHWIALRVIREIVRDWRTLAFFFLVPVIVMWLVYFAIAKDEVARIGIVARGTARLFAAPIGQALARAPDLRLVPLDVPDDAAGAELEARIRDALRAGRADGVLLLDDALLADRLAGRAGTLRLFVEGSRPTLTGTLTSALGGAAASLAAGLPVSVAAGCPARCAAPSAQPVQLRTEYLYGAESYRLIDFFLPVLLPFFVFFFTFMVSTITFQRERARGTLERLLIAPVGFTQVVLGYLAGFFLFSLCQVAVVLVFILSLITFTVTAGQVLALVALSVLVMLIALLTGLWVSFNSANEFQAVQFVPLIILPQIFLSDMIWTLDGFPPFFRGLALLLPLTHANAVTRNLLLKHYSFWQTWPNLLALGGFFAVVLVLLAVEGRRAQHP